MRIKPVLLIAAILMLSISCTKKEPNPVWMKNQNSKQIIFFSDKEKHHQEISYYDAIIELKKVYPDEMKNMKIISYSEMREYYDIFKVDTCPALIVYYNNEIICEIIGEKATNDIVSSLSEILKET